MNVLKGSTDERSHMCKHTGKENMVVVKREGGSETRNGKTEYKHQEQVTGNNQA